MTKGPRAVTVNPDACRAEELAQAAAWLRDGGIVALPTDTFYGLAVDIGNANAVRRLFALKGRVPRAALPLIAASAAQVAAFGGRLDLREAALAAAFWPGPLSIVRDAPPGIVPEVHGGHRTVAIRVPAHAVARKFCEVWGGPVSATSANRSGSPAVSRAEALAAIADDPHVFVINGGETPGGQPSTLVDVRAARPILLREGAIPWSRVLEFLHS